MTTTPSGITMRKPGTATSEGASPDNKTWSAQEPTARPSRSRPNSRSSRSRVLIGLPIVAALVGAFWWMRSGSDGGGESSRTFAVELRSLPIVLSEKGELKAKNSVDIKCEIEGSTRILSLIDEGTVVKAGDLLVELAGDQIEEKLRAERLKETSAIAAHEAATKEYEIQLDENDSNIRKGELAVRVAELNLAKYKEGDWQQQLQEADLGLKRSEAMLKRTQAKLEDSEKLAAKNFISQQELEDDQFSVYEAEITLQKAQLTKRILLDYTNPVEREQKDSDLHEAEQELERTRKSAEANASKRKANMDSRATELDYIRQNINKYEDQLNKCKILAPSAGFVVYYNEGGRWYGGETQIREGAEVYERQTILTIPDPAVMTASLRIHEAKVDKIQVGQGARVEVEGVPGRVFDAKITKIAMLADSRNRWLNPDLKEYETVVTLAETEVELKPGATVHVDIQVDHLEDVLAVPIQSIFSKAGRSYVFLDRGDEAGEPVPVKLGASNNEYVEVREGLDAGQNILLAVTDDLKRLIPDGAPLEFATSEASSIRQAGSRERSLSEKGHESGRIRKASAAISPGG